MAETITEENVSSNEPETSEQNEKEIDTSGNVNEDAIGNVVDVTEDVVTVIEKHDTENDISEYGEMIPAYETKTEREARILTACRNAPCDIPDVKNAEKTLKTSEIPPSASLHFRAVESFIAASSWPAGVFAACFIIIMAIAGYCSLYNSIVSAIILAVAICGIWVRKSRLPIFALTDLEEDNREIIENQLEKVSRRSLRSGEYSEMFMSVLLGIAFVLLSVFLPLSISYFIAMLFVFCIAWFMAGQYISASSPYCDVYDTELSDGQMIALISFDTPIPGEKRRLVKIDDRAYVALLRDSTKEFLGTETSTFQLNQDGIITKK